VTNLVQTNHLRCSRTHRLSGTHLFDYAIFEHCFHSLIDSSIKLFPVAIYEYTSMRFAAYGFWECGDMSPLLKRGNVRALQVLRVQRGGYRPLSALSGSGLVRKQSNLQRSDQTAAIFCVDLSRGFRIQIDKQSPQIIRTPLVQFRAQFQVRRGQRG
jgi:hypothetical protein